MIAAVEDLLSEAVVKKLVAAIRPELSISFVARNGRSHIEKKARELNRAAHKVPVLILADLDRPQPCPADLISQFIQGAPGPMLLFRIAVMEIESWIMADRDGFAGFLGVPPHRIPANTDSVPQPKEFIVNLARKSKRRNIREDLVPAPGGTAAIGPAFNPRIASFVVNEWDFSRAAHASPSLRRAIERLGEAFK